MSQYEPKNYTILMVDDMPQNLQVLGNILRNQGYNFEFATSGEKALEWLDKQVFDIILLDVMMPKMNGFELCEKLKGSAKYSDMPVIFLTAQADTHSVVKGFEVGGQDYITKPFDRGELLMRIQTQLELKESRQKLKELNAMLDNKVKQRTAELDEANEKLRALNSELIDLDAEKAEFLQIISHEIRTPLNSILGFMDIIKASIEDESLLEFIRHIDISTHRLEKFAYQALLITELRTKRHKIIKDEFNIKETIELCIQDVVKQRSDNKAVSIDLDKKVNETTIIAERRYFKKALTIILTNAFDNSVDGGNIKVGVVKTNQDVGILVKDEGAGFSEKSLSSLFELFAPGSRHVDENTGLNMAIANLIMHAHGGCVKVINNNGAEVTLLFPINEI